MEENYYRIRLKCEFELIENDDGTTAVPLGKGDGMPQGVIRLENESARFIFDLLREGKYRLPDIIFLCMKKYQGTKVEEAGPMVLDFLNKFRENNMLDLYK